MQQYHDNEYLKLVKHVLETGDHKEDRTGTGTRSVFGYQMRFDLSNGSIPLLTTKKMFIRGIIYELLWYLRGETNIEYLNKHNVKIWDEWADEKGNLGPVYGKQWRNWESVNFYNVNGPFGKFTEHNIVSTDQIQSVITQLLNNPNDRRMIVSAWNVGEIEQMNLPPCHCLFQFWAHEGKLKCQLYQRSCDIGLGVPFNIVQYSILTHMIAHVTGHEAVEFIWTGGDCHIYHNHVDQLQEQLLRTPYPSPRLELNKDVTDINKFQYEDFKIVGYDKFHPSISMDVSV